MEPERRQRKDRKDAMEASSIHDLSDDLLRRIFLRLDCSLWLIRAACACKRWRRAITDDGADEGRAFLRLARSLHPPTVVGHYHKDTRFLRSSSLPIESWRFYIKDFDEKDPSVADSHGGLVLLRTKERPSLPYSDVSNLVVYDPLTRKRRWLSRLRPPNKKGFRYNINGIRDVFLLDDNDGHISLSNHRVLYRLHYTVVPAADDPKVCAVFSSANGGEWEWSFSNHDVSRMELGRVLPEETHGETRQIFNYTLPWPQFLRAVC